MAARRVLLSGYSGAGADIRMAEVSAEGRLRGGEGLRHGENPSFCCWMDGRVYAVAELPQGASVTAYALEGDALRPLGRMELPGRRGLCHLAAVDGVLYGSCYESGHYFALDAELSRVLWEVPARGHAPGPLGAGSRRPAVSGRPGQRQGVPLCPAKRPAPRGGGNPVPAGGQRPPPALAPPPGRFRRGLRAGRHAALFPGGRHLLRRAPRQRHAGTQRPRGRSAGWATRFSWGTGGPTRCPPSA